MHDQNNKGSMIWMAALHIVPMGLLLFWNKIPVGYTWVVYVGIGLFVLAHFSPMFGGGNGGCCGVHKQTEHVPDTDKK